MQSGTQRNKVLITGIVCFLAGVVLSALLDFSSPRDNPTVLRADKSGYTYINPLLLCQNYEDGEFIEFAPLKRELSSITSEAQKDGTILTGSVYFRDLNSGRWTGINENELYTPASLLKVPILIAYLKMAEKNPSVLTEKIYYKQEEGQRPPLIDSFILNSGQHYTVEDLLRGMIVDSDNSAKNILESRLDKDFIGEVYSELGIPSPYGERTAYQISTRTYALFFRVLYNATYLEREMSEKAFSILADVKFDKGLKAGTPKNIPVANKYGFSVVKRDNPRVVELSDCGIIYNPGDPHLLCVMARANDPEVAARYIADITTATSNLGK